MLENYDLYSAQLILSGVMLGDMVHREKMFLDFPFSCLLKFFLYIFLQESP